MARKRMLSPEFFTSAPVNRLPVTAMMTFAGLWCYFDDYGRGEDDAALVKAVVWPRRRSQTEAKVAADLAAIEAEGLICRYDAAGIALIHTVSWDEHQRISHKTPSKLPPCPKHEPDDLAIYLRVHPPSPNGFRNLSGTSPEHLANSSGAPPLPSRATRGKGLREQFKTARRQASLVTERCKHLSLAEIKLFALTVP